MNKVFDDQGNKLSQPVVDPKSGLSTKDLKEKHESAKDVEVKKGFVRVTMKKNATGSVDGIRPQEFIEGKEYDLPVGLYSDFVTLEAVEEGLDKQQEKHQQDKHQHHEKAHKDAPKNK